MGACPTDAVETIVTRLTPPGRGAIATLLVAGPAAVDRIEPFFSAANGRALADQPIRRIVFGRWRATGTDNVGEDLVVCRTSETRIEVHCHGGNAAAAAILDTLQAAGCTPHDWSEAPAATSEDALQADAHRALALAPTRRTASILLDQYHGALDRAIDAAIALCDGGQADQAADCLRDILQHADLGRHLTVPWRVVLAGRPNVGKSSLINALVGYERSIVFDQPGTTRDVVTATTAVEGWPIELADTAGLRTPGEIDAGSSRCDALEAAGMARAKDVLQRADLVVLVFDASQAPSEEDAQLHRAWPGALQVANKMDLAPLGDVPPSMLPTSATLGTGIDRLVSAIAERLVPAAPPAGAPVPFTDEHVAILHSAIEQLASNKSASASQTLRQLC